MQSNSFWQGYSIYADESEDDSDVEEEDDFSESYADALCKELKSSTLSKSFIRANEQRPRTDEVLIYFHKFFIQVSLCNSLATAGTASGLI